MKHLDLEDVEKLLISLLIQIQEYQIFSFSIKSYFCLVNATFSIFPFNVFIFEVFFNTYHVKNKRYIPNVPRVAPYYIYWDHFSVNVKKDPPATVFLIYGYLMEYFVTVCQQDKSPLKNIEQKVEDFENGTGKFETFKSKSILINNLIQKDYFSTNQSWIEQNQKKNDQ